MAQRVVRRTAEPATAPAAERVPAGREISLVLSERHQLHTTAAGDSRPGNHDDRPAAASRSLTTLRALAERCAVSATEGRLCKPTNVARNYYDGRDFDISHTLTLAFASAGAAARFLADAEPPLTHWLACRRARTATLYVGDAEIVLAGERELELACARVERIAAAQRIAPRRIPAVL